MVQDVSQGKNVYTFSKGNSDGRKDMKLLLGGKGANLCEMARNGLNVPPGLTITTEVCQQFYEAGKKIPDNVWEEVKAAVAETEKAYGQGAGFGKKDNPLLFSVRSGAAVSMPGMMDTVLNLGLNDEIIQGLVDKRGERFAYDCYRRFLDMFGDVVLGIEHEHFEHELASIKKRVGAKLDVELTGPQLKEVVEAFKGVYKKVGKTVPTDPWEQLHMAADAVFRSWNIPRAIKYRELNGITGLKGTAVNIQCMVYGNASDKSGTGVLFTRNPATGEAKLYGEYLVNAQGEDVVAGIRTPVPIATLQEQFPKVYAELDETVKNLEKYMKDMQDIEFTVQDEVLYLLQTRNGKRTGAAALKIALDLKREGMVDEEQSVMLMEARHLDQLLHPQFEDFDKHKDKILATGLAASPGAGVGRVVFSAEEAEAWKEKGEKVILVRIETSPEDVGGMHVAEAILTQRGGMTSHAAVVARGWGKPCVCGCEVVEVDYANKRFQVKKGGQVLAEVKEGDWLSINGSTGDVVPGQLPLKKAEVYGDLAEFMASVDKFRKLEVHTNADTPADAAVARKNGAQGIGLVRTEHMFFATPQRIRAVRRMIAAFELKTKGVEEALKEIKEFQREDFEGIFREMTGLPVTIRLLDPPLHEFLPHEGKALDDLCEEIGKELGEKPDVVATKIAALNEANPMMGFRGCRLGIVHPEITEMQAQAILEAACTVQKEGKEVTPHIMVPLVGSVTELTAQEKVIRAAAKKVFAEQGVEVKYEVGTMIEIPRAALCAEELAKTAEFFSFGTNDLTQMTYGFSRDDAEAKFLPQYAKNNVIEVSPFKEIDQTGVGELIKIAVERGRKGRPNIGLGICGEHGGDPNSVEFFHSVGLDYVSCSPLRVPIARLAAAQAVIKAKKAANKA